MEQNSVKAIVIKGYEDLAELQVLKLIQLIENTCSYTYVMISLSLAVVGITTRLLCVC